MTRGHHCVLVVLLLLAHHVGCGPRVGAVPVSGTVMVDGQPAAGLTVQFSPATGERPSTGYTDASGRFSLRYNREVVGVLPGKHLVTFSWSPQSEDDTQSPAQRVAVTRHGVEKGQPYPVEVVGPIDNLAIAIDGDPAKE